MSGNSHKSGRRATVVIPTLNAATHLESLIPAVLAQKSEWEVLALVIDSGSTDGALDVVAGHANVEILRVNAFSHGRVRNLGVRSREADVVVFLSQDARPVGDSWLANLLKPFSDPTVAAAFSRQIPYADAPPMERFFLETHFPADRPERMVKRGDRKPTFQNGIFFSNVSSAVRREVALRHPFDEDLIMSEDQQLARDLIEAGHAVVYEPSSVVFHSHCYTLPLVFRRYFDSVYSLTKIFEEHTLKASVALGLRYLRKEAWFMLKRHPLMLPYYACYTMNKSVATVLAHYADHLPRKLRKKMSYHRFYWDR